MDASDRSEYSSPPSRRLNRSSTADGIKSFTSADAALTGIVPQVRTNHDIILQITNLESAVINNASNVDILRQISALNLQLITRRQEVSRFVDDHPDQVYVFPNSGQSSLGGIDDHSSPRAGRQVLSRREYAQDHASHPSFPVARLDADPIQSGRLTPLPASDAFEYIEPAKYQPDLNLEDGKAPAPGTSSKLWACFAFFVTFPVPDFCICKQGIGAKMAWRQKVTICFLFFLVSAVFAAAVTLVPMFICNESEQYYDMDHVEKNGWTTVFGKVYNLEEFIDIHPGGSAVLRDFRGVDASQLFARLPPTELPSFCLSDHLSASVFNETNSLGLQNITCQLPSADEILLYGEEGNCHKTLAGMENMEERLGQYQEGELVIAGRGRGPNGLPDGTQVILIDNIFYNVTKYLDQLRAASLHVGSKTGSDDYAYLSASLHDLVVNKVNEDATELFHRVFPQPADREVALDCLNELFYHARVDDEFRGQCDRISLVEYAVAAILGLFIFVQVSCSLAYIARRPPVVRDEDKRAAVMVMVPCYNESDKELRKTIDSVLATDYPDEKKVLVMVVDGVMTRRGETMSCPERLAAILGFKFSTSDDTQAYRSTGAETTNYASIYPGRYSSKKYLGKELQYIVVVKQGGAEERDTGRGGHRGKRDSQLLLFGLLNRLQYNRRPTELDMTFMVAMKRVGMVLTDVEYLMAVDADTRVSKDSISLFVHSMAKDKSVLACCGETRIDNMSQSFTTMIQVFEYYSAHHVKKAFESVFGCVTYLPGGFTMYRLYTGELQPLLARDSIFREYARNDITSLHERNLYDLSEDRLLTTLMLQEFHTMKLNFVPEAISWTVVPHTFQMLQRQRRRWINSAFHNMFELLKLDTMCGVCLFSMKMVVIFDLVSTFLLPSGCVYLYYIVVGVFLNDEPLSPLQYVAFGYVGVMTLPFVFRAQWDYFLWFLVFLIGGIPVFYFYLPMYAFWYMDDFSWWDIRQVQPGKKSECGGVKSKSSTESLQKPERTIHRENQNITSSSEKPPSITAR